MTLVAGQAECLQTTIGKTVSSADQDIYDKHFFELLNIFLVILFFCGTLLVHQRRPWNGSALFLGGY